MAELPEDLTNAIKDGEAAGAAVRRAGGGPAIQIRSNNPKFDQIAGDYGSQVVQFLLALLLKAPRDGAFIAVGAAAALGALVEADCPEDQKAIMRQGLSRMLSENCEMLVFDVG